MLKFRHILLAVAFILVFGRAKTQSDLGHVYTTGYSKDVLTFSFVDGHLDESRRVESEENLTFATFDEELSTLYASHEVASYEGFGNSGAISRWQVGADQDGVPPTFTKLQVDKTKQKYLNTT
jgi:6-phosphogluconolactonase (cycloisomerase 2 family)